MNMNEKKKNDTSLVKYFNQLYHTLPKIDLVEVESNVQRFPFYIIDINSERYLLSKSVGYASYNARNVPDPERRFLLCQTGKSRSSLLIKVEQVIKDFFSPGTFVRNEINKKLLYDFIVTRFKIEDLEELMKVRDIPNVKLSEEQINLCNHVFDERIRLLKERTPKDKRKEMSVSMVPFTIPADFIDIIERISNFVKEHPDERAETHRVFDSTLHILESIKI